MAKIITGRRGRQANIVGASSAAAGCGGLAGVAASSGATVVKTTTASTPTATTSAVAPVVRAGNETVGSNPLLQTGSSSREDIGIVVGPTGGSSSGSGGSSGSSGASTPSTPSTPSAPTTTPTATPTVTEKPITSTPTVTTPEPATPTKIIVAPNANLMAPPETTRSTAPVVIGKFDEPEPEINLPYPVAVDPVAPPFEDIRPTETDEDGDDAMGGNEDGFGGLDGLINDNLEHPIGNIDMPINPPSGRDAQPVEPGGEQPDEMPVRSGKSKAWLVVIAAGIVLWLLFKKRK